MTKINICFEIAFETTQINSFNQFIVITICSVNEWMGKCTVESELESDQVRVKMKNSFLFWYLFSSGSCHIVTT